MTKEFEFVDAGHTFSCSVEAPLHAGMPPWWFYRVDTGETTRYAPFAASPDDTRKSVQARIIAHYAEVLAIKARPVHQRPAWGRPRPPAPADGAVDPTAPAAPVSALAEEVAAT